MDINLSEYRKKSPLTPFYTHSIIGYIGCVLSPYLGVFCIKRNWIPNKLTLAMIITGVLGGIFLMIPSIICKGISVLLYILWFTWDCADGEVARITKTFSKYGTQLDWVAHLSCHSLFVFAIWLSYYQYYDSHLFLFTICTIVILAAELVQRSLISINYFCFNTGGEGNGWTVKKLFSVIYVKMQLSWFPNFIFIISLSFVVDVLFNLNFFFWIYSIWSILYAIMVFKKFCIITNVFYKS